MQQNSWCAQIINAKTTATIIDILGSNNFADIAKRLADLNVMAKENGETIVLQSLQKFAIFVACEKLPTFNIGINPDGFIQLLCRAPDHGSLAMDFLPSGDVVFSILFYLHEPGSRQQKVSGRVSLHRVMHYIIEFIDRTATQ